MTDLAIGFAWVFGLSDRRAGLALGLAEGTVRRRRRRLLGLAKGGGGWPVL